MKKIFAIIWVSILPAIGFSQHEKTPADGASQLKFIKKPEEAAALAQKDIKNQTAFLLVQGGFAPVVYAQDKNFEKVYRVRFSDFGCVSPNPKLVKAYNTEIFKHLTKKFGKKWLAQCRKDVIGLQDYRKTL